MRIIKLIKLVGRRPRGVGINCLVALEREAWRNEFKLVVKMRIRINSYIITFIILLILMILIIPSPGCLQYFPMSLLRLSSNHCLIRHGSSSTNQHSCHIRCAGCSLIPSAPLRATIWTATAIAFITVALRSRRSNGSNNSESNCGHIDHGDHCSHCGPCRGRGGFADA